MSRRAAGVLAVLVCLLVVGAVRSAIPSYLPTQSHVVPDERGVVRLEVADVELLEVAAARQVESDGYTPVQLSSEGVFVVARVRITPHGGTLLVNSELQTSDGRIYKALKVGGMSSPGIAYVGQRVIETHVFEIPEPRLAGAHLVVSGAGEDGVQAIQPVAWIGLDVDLEPGVLTAEGTVVEPAP